MGLSHTFSGSKNNQDLKRKRVTRACDICRQKKVKCDGKQPCIHCTVYSYSCTYDQPNVRNKKNTGIPVAQASPVILKVAAAAAAAAAAGNTPMPSPSFFSEPQSITITNNLIICQNILNVLLPRLKLNCLDDTNPLNFDFEKFQKAVSYVGAKNNGNLNVNEVCDLYQDGPVPRILPNFDNRRPSVSSNEETPLGQEIRLFLPNKDVALQLIFTTWNKACVLFRFYHRPSLLEEVELLYSVDPLHYGDRQQKFLPFLYSILACGSLFSKTNEASPNFNENLEDDGFKYFLEARKLIDISNVGDINSIQTIVMMIMYLQCSARLSTCYSYIGIALRSALKEGLHRNLSIFQHSKRKLDPIEIDTRKRLFYTIYKMDIYINSLLGLPRSINEDEFDQEYPEELDDENITRTEYLYANQQGRLSSSACANHHTKLMLVLSHIVKQLYPIKVKKTEKVSLTPDNIHAKVTILELELKAWLDNLPVELKPTDPTSNDPRENIPEKFEMANYYIHLSFLNCQIMLYRPFIHFISNGTSYAPNADPRSLIRGRNCIKVARIVVKLANKMIDENLLVGTYWFSMYTIFFSIACLIYYYHFANYSQNKTSGFNYAGVLFDDDLNIDMIKKDIEIGKKVLDCLKNNSNASLRIYNILNALFEQLNRRTADSTRLRSSPDQSEINLNTNIQSEAVESTFKNFDKMNNYVASGEMKENENYPPSLEEHEKQGKEKDFENSSRTSTRQPKNSQISETGTTKSNVALNSHKKALNHQILKMAGFPDFSSPQEVLEKPTLGNEPDNGTNSNKAEGSGSVDYLPGVIDRLDAQIFGRILPPYMLQKNAQYSGMSLQNDIDSLDRKDFAEPNLSQDNLFPQNSQFADFADLDFSLLGDDNLNYLDPFTSNNE